MKKLLCMLLLLLTCVTYSSAVEPAHRIDAMASVNFPNVVYSQYFGVQYSCEMNYHILGAEVNFGYVNDLVIDTDVYYVYNVLGTNGDYNPWNELNFGIGIGYRNKNGVNGGIIPIKVQYVHEFYNGIRLGAKFDLINDVNPVDKYALDMRLGICLGYSFK